jgi:surface protein
MRGMFFSADSFNQPLNNWDVSGVTSMRDMFSSADLFNQPLNSWDVSNVTDMRNMFRSASTFNQDISSWCVEQIPSEPIGFASNAPLAEANKPNWGVTCSLSSIGFNKANVVIYPNPVVGGILNVKLTDNDEQISFKISNMLGQIVKQGKLTNAQIDVDRLQTGVYLLEISDSSQTSIERFIVR